MERSKKAFPEEYARIDRETDTILMLKKDNGRNIEVGDVMQEIAQ